MKHVEVSVLPTVLSLVSFLIGFALGLYIVTSFIRTGIWKAILFFLALGLIMYLLSVYLGINITSILDYIKYLKELILRTLLEYVPSAYLNLFVIGLVVGALVGAIKSIIDYFVGKK